MSVEELLENSLLIEKALTENAILIAGLPHGCACANHKLEMEKDLIKILQRMDQQLSDKRTAQACDTSSGCCMPVELNGPSPPSGTECDHQHGNEGGCDVDEVSDCSGSDGYSELGGMSQLTIAPSNSGVDIHMQHSVHDSPEKRRCSYCLERLDSSHFSKSQWKAKKPRERYQRTREPAACEDFELALAAFHADGEPFTWRRCLQCSEIHKCVRAELTSDMSFLSEFSTV